MTILFYKAYLVKVPTKGGRMGQKYQKNWPRDLWMTSRWSTEKKKCRKLDFKHGETKRAIIATKQCVSSCH